MTTHKRSVEHRMLKARQGGNGGGNGTNPPPDNGNGNGGPNDDEPDGGNDGGSQSSTTSSSTTSSSSSTTSSSSTSSTRSSSTQPPPSTTSSTTSRTSTTSSTSSTPTTTSTTLSTTSTTSTTSRATTTTSATVNNVVGTTTGRVNQASSFRDVPTMSIDPATGATVTAGPLEETGGISTGGIVGSVAGGLAALAILGFIVAWLLRRQRRKRLEDDDFGTDFRRSAFVSGSHPPSMAEASGARGHSIAPSLSSPGVAGQGAYSSSYGATDNSTGGSGAGAAAAGVAVGAAAVATGVAASQGLQERPKYVYGQMEPNQQNSGDDHGDDYSEHAHGAYSSEPMVQQAYNAEAYGSYAAYDGQGYNQNYQDGNGGYQDATREYQGQEGYAVGGYDQAYGYQNHPYGQQTGQQANYDASQYAQYDPNQYAQYDQSAYVATGNAPAAGSSDPRHNDAYGGM